MITEWFVDGLQKYERIPNKGVCGMIYTRFHEDSKAVVLTVEKGGNIQAEFHSEHTYD